MFASIKIQQTLFFSKDLVIAFMPKITEFLKSFKNLKNLCKYILKKYTLICFKILTLALNLIYFHFFEVLLF